VDIICTPNPSHIDWLRHNNRLEKTILKAYSKNIFVLMSCPNDYSFRNIPREVTKIGSCNRYGQLSSLSTPEFIDFAFNGEDIPLEILPFLTQNTPASGIQIATAIATGLASVILSCNYGTDTEHGVVGELIPEFFISATSQGSKVVNFQHLGSKVGGAAGQLMAKLFGREVGNFL
jgi:hypothetical protein